MANTSVGFGTNSIISGFRQIPLKETIVQKAREVVEEDDFDVVTETICCSCGKEIGKENTFDENFYTCPSCDKPICVSCKDAGNHLHFVVRSN